jgi:hypothetical protein
MISLEEADESSKSSSLDFPASFRVNFTELGKNFNMKFAKMPATSGKKQTSPSNIYVIDQVTAQPKKFNLINEDVRNLDFHETLFSLMVLILFNRGSSTTWKWTVTASPLSYATRTTRSSRFES